jgi:hypothetical protein
MRSNAAGRCSYCGAYNVAILSPADLFEYFQLLISAYQPDDAGQPLVHWFRKDWRLFSHPSMDDPRAKDLLSEILDDGEIVRQSFSPMAAVAMDRLGEWQTLRDELMHQNRFFPDANIDLDRLEELLDILKMGPDEIPDLWYRARIKTRDDPYTIEEMGAPSNKLASNGRANPAGIPYLYLGSTPVTAIAEIRPHTGEAVCVASFTTPPDLKLVDLRNPRQMVSPFLLADADEIGKMRGDLPFLERLGDELTRPVVPQSAAIDYTPSQYVCEFIKKCKFDGVVYRSSVSEGINLALFRPPQALPGTVTEYSVDKVSVEATPRERRV